METLKVGLGKVANQKLPALPDHLCLVKAAVALRMGDAGEAQRITLQLLNSDPTHVGALELLAKAQWQLNDSTALLDTLAKLIRINPYEPGYHTLRGNALKNLARYGEAVRAFVRAGDAPGAKESVVELGGIQSEIVLQLLDEDPVFKAQYGQDPEKACASRGFEFGSETKIRHRVLLNEYSATTVRVRPS